MGKRSLLSLRVLATLAALLTACAPTAAGLGIPGIDSAVEWQGGTVRVTGVELVACFAIDEETGVHAQPGHTIVLVSLEEKNVDMWSKSRAWGLEDADGDRYEVMGLKERKFTFEVEEPGSSLVLWLDGGPRIPLDTLIEQAAAPAATCPPPPGGYVSLEELPSPTSGPPLAALVNGQPIYLADFEHEVAQYAADLPLEGIDPNSPEGQADLADARPWILDWLITEVLILQAADAAGIVVSDEELSTSLQDMVEENGGMAALEAKLAERGETYEHAREKIRVGLITAAMKQHIIDGVPTVAEHVHARHILVDTPEEAERLYAQLQAGADFASLAKSYSQDSNTHETGGDLGWFPRGILTVPEVEETAFALQPGQFSEVVPSLLGYHIVQIVERDPARPVSPENLRLLMDRALQEWDEGLRAQAEIQIFVETTP